MKLPSWLSPKKNGKSGPALSTIEEVRARRRAALADIADAERLVAEALVALETERTEEACSAWEAAGERLKKLRALSVIVDGDVAKAEAKDAADKRLQLQRRLTELQAELDNRSKEEALSEQKASAYLAVVDVEVARREHERSRRRHQNEQNAIREELGFEQHHHEISSLPSDLPVTRLLDQHAARLAGDDDRRLVIQELVSLLRPNGVPPSFLARN